MKRYFDRLFHFIITSVTLCASLIILLVFVSIVKESIPFFKAVNLNAFVLGSSWKPLAQNPLYGLLPMIAATLYVSLLAVLLAMPIGVGCALYLCFCVKQELAKLILTFIDMLAGIPSVIFGFMGLTILVKFMENHLQMTSGESVLAAGILLGIMLLPYVITGCTETFEISKARYYPTSLSLGLSKWYTLRHLILPAGRNSMLSQMLLAFGRAMGETMAVMMVLGNAPIFPRLMGRAQTIPSLIALEMGSATYQSTHYSALYGAGLILIILLIFVQFLAKWIKSYTPGRRTPHEK